MTMLGHRLPGRELNAVDARAHDLALEMESAALGQGGFVVLGAAEDLPDNVVEWLVIGIPDTVSVRE